MRGLLGLVTACWSTGCLTQVELARTAPDEVWVIGDVPAATIARFAADASRVTDPRLQLTYPEPESEIPANLGALRIAWELKGKVEAEMPPPMGMMKAKGEPGPAAAAYFELCLRNELRALCAYTDGSQVDIDGARLAPLAADRLPLVLQLRALVDAEQPVLAASEITLGLSAPLASGTLYYQAQDQLWRAPISGASAEAWAAGAGPEAPRFVISRDGTRMLYAPSPEELQWLSLPERTVLWSRTQPLMGPSQASLALDPLGQRIALARGGRLVILAAQTGEILSALDALDAKDAPRVSHPDWSPDGSHLVVTLWPAAFMADEGALEGTSLARIAVGPDATFSAPELLVGPAQPDETLCFPAYSRAGTWIAYLRFKGKLRDKKEAALWITPSAGGPAAPVVHEKPMKDAKKALQLEPAAPVWWPSEDGDGLAWLTVSAQGPLTGKTPQLYLLPVNEAALTEGASAEASGVWLPFQDPEVPSRWPARAP